MGERDAVTISRRQFLTGLAGIASLYPLLKKDRQPIPGAIVGASAAHGHRLRDSQISTYDSQRRVPVVIVGGGIAGLSAAWRLAKRGFHDFELLELESEVGGNSSYGENAISAYPWGAHYVPPAGRDARFLTELFEDLGVITGRDGAGRPIYDEYYLCAAPQERLYANGRWQEGLFPHLGASKRDEAQLSAFLSAMEEYKRARGTDGKAAFAIPLEESSRDPRFTSLDRISMSEFMRDRGWDSKALRWYVDYCCRDDYGSNLRDVSAWAGIHYFASRDFEAANISEYTVLTWPEGNGWLVKRMRDAFTANIRAKRLVTRVRAKGRESEVDVLHLDTGKAERIRAGTVIYAAPRFTAPFVIEEWKSNRPAHTLAFEYSPWMVANVTVQRPQESHSDIAWDNVIYDSASLGYINATHQSLRASVRQTVLTYYLPLCHKSPKEARPEALKRSHAEWADMVARDLERPHPGIRSTISRLDVWLWGHGMIRPKPGFIWGTSRAEARRPLGNVFFAHSDMSGISIFEEAQYWGISAAEGTLRRLGVHPHS